MLQKFKKLILLMSTMLLLLLTPMTALALESATISDWSWSGFRIMTISDTFRQYAFDADWYCFTQYDSTGDVRCYDKYFTLAKHNSKYDYPQPGETILIQTMYNENFADYAGCSMVAYSRCWKYRPKGSDRDLGVFYLLKVNSGPRNRYIKINIASHEHGGESEGYWYSSPFNIYIETYPSNHSHQWGAWILAEGRCFA